MIKTLRQIILERNFFKLIVIIHRKSIANISGERVNIFPLKLEKRLSVLTTFIQHDGSCSQCKKAKKGNKKYADKKGRKKFLFADDTISL